ncbi:hypothetical protein [Chitinophaga sp.]|uniref:hypothetical protein n=1 Tax=Chitinophaga sp. TaxID=1869181 RepID=UPI0031D6A2F9
MKKFLLIAILLFSCKKDEKSTPPVTHQPEKVAVRLVLTGDITTSWSNLKTVYDSTIYAVSIRTYTGAPFAQGLFDNTDSIKLEVLKDSSYNIYVAAIRKGSSFGLWWETAADGYRKYATPMQGKLQNKMRYDSLQTTFIDSLSFMKVLKDTVSRAADIYRYPEVDTYYGMTNYTARDPNNTNVSLELGRRVFAIRYDLHNLTSGYVLATYGGLIAPDTLKTNDTLPSRIYTANAFTTGDNTTTVSVPITLTWVKGNGTTEVLGTKTLTTKKNTVTSVSVYLSVVPGQVTPLFTLDNSPWAGTDDIDF